MYGLAYIVVENYLLARFSESGFSQLLTETELAEIDPWVAPLRYPEKPWFRLVQAAANMAGEPVHDLLVDCARQAVPTLLKRFNSIVRGYADPIALVEDLCKSSHPELKHLLPEGEGFEVHFDWVDPRRARLRIDNNPWVANLIEGLLRGLVELPRFAMTIQPSKIQSTMGEPGCQFDLIAMSGGHS